LKVLKESFPVQVAEYVTSQGLQDLPAFRWWVKDTLRHSNRIIKAVKTRYLKQMPKYSIQLPRTVEEAYEVDLATGTDLWHQVILKEMKNNVFAF
jgi:hypothetical protein